MPEKAITQLAWKIQLLLMDVDGVMTDGMLLLVPLPDGSVAEAKAFNVNDGAALAMVRRAGLRIGIISGRSSAALTRRAEELKVDFFYHGLGRTKISALEDIFEKTKLAKDRVCYVGDDVQDLPLFSRVGFPIAVANASPDVAAKASYITRSAGGRGAIREVVELILRAQGKWDAALKEFED
jgi:3-deoxy-D-manno-octulosonate 8-phosphate phosphatase (KDO 8-P phosphatase)